MSYHTLFLVAFASHTMGDWSHHSLARILLGSLIFAAFFVLTWAGIDRLTERRTGEPT